MRQYPNNRHLIEILFDVLTFYLDGLEITKQLEIGCPSVKGLSRSLDRFASLHFCHKLGVRFDLSVGGVFNRRPKNGHKHRQTDRQTDN